MIRIAYMCRGTFDVLIDKIQKYDVPYFYVVDRGNGSSCCIQVNGPAYLETAIPNKFLTVEQKNCLMACLRRNRQKGLKYNNWEYMIDLMIEFGYKYVYESTKKSIPYYNNL